MPTISKQQALVALTTTTHTRARHGRRQGKGSHRCAGPMSQSRSKGALEMPLLLLVVALVLLGVLALGGVDSRDGADWSPPTLRT